MKKLLLSVLLASISVNPVFGDHHKKQDVRPATKEDFIRFMKSSQGMWRAEVLSVISDNSLGNKQKKNNLLLAFCFSELLLYDIIWKRG